MAIDATVLEDALEFEFAKHAYIISVNSDYLINQEWRDFNKAFFEFSRKTMTDFQRERWVAGNISHSIMCEYIADIWNYNSRRNHKTLVYNLRHISYEEIRDIYQPWYDDRNRQLQFDLYVRDFCWLPFTDYMEHEFEALLNGYLDGTYLYKGDAKLCAHWNTIVDSHREVI